MKILYGKCVGQTTMTSKGPTTFDENGVAEVEGELAEHWTKVPGVRILDDEPATGEPATVVVEDDPATGAQSPVVEDDEPQGAVQTPAEVVDDNKPLLELSDEQKAEYEDLLSQGLEPLDALKAVLGEEATVQNEEEATVQTEPEADKVTKSALSKMNKAQLIELAQKSNIEIDPTANNDVIRAILDKVLNPVED